MVNFKFLKLHFTRGREFSVDFDLVVKALSYYP